MNPDRIHRFKDIIPFILNTCLPGAGHTKSFHQLGGKLLLIFKIIGLAGIIVRII